MELLDEIMEYVETWPKDGTADGARAAMERMHEQIVAMEGIVREYSRSATRNGVQIALVTLIPRPGRGREGGGEREGEGFIRIRGGGRGGGWRGTSDAAV